MPTRSLFVLIVFVCCSSSLRGTLIEAHRGNSHAAPENTLASIQAANGIADLTEMDVRVSQDGQLVLMHDAGLWRTTNGRGPVRRQSLAKLKTLDAGSWFSGDFAMEPIPTLEEAIQSAMALGIEPLIERKAGDAELYHSEFQRLGLDESEFRVISFNRNFIADLHSLNPDYNLGILGWGAITPLKLGRLAAMGADFISWRHTNVRRQPVVDLVHANDMELHVWTVNRLDRMQELLDLGVDGITTDEPALLHSLVNGSLVAPQAAGAGIKVGSFVSVGGNPVPEPGLGQVWLGAILLWVFSIPRARPCWISIRQRSLYRLTRSRRRRRCLDLDKRLRLRLRVKRGLRSTLTVAETATG